MVVVSVQSRVRGYAGESATPGVVLASVHLLIPLLVGWFVHLVCDSGLPDAVAGFAFPG